MPATTAALIRENTHTEASELDNSRMYTSFQTLHRALCSTVLRFPRAYNCVGKPARRIVANPDMWSSKDRNDRIPFNASRLLRSHSRTTTVILIDAATLRHTYVHWRVSDKGADRLQLCGIPIHD